MVAWSERSTRNSTPYSFAHFCSPPRSLTNSVAFRSTEIGLYAKTKRVEKVMVLECGGKNCWKPRGEQTAMSSRVVKNCVESLYSERLKDSHTHPEQWKSELQQLLLHYSSIPMTACVCRADETSIRRELSNSIVYTCTL